MISRFTSITRTAWSEFSTIFPSTYLKHQNNVVRIFHDFSFYLPAAPDQHGQNFPRFSFYLPAAPEQHGQNSPRFFLLLTSSTRTTWIEFSTIFLLLTRCTRTTWSEFFTIFPSTYQMHQNNMVRIFHDFSFYLPEAPEQQGHDLHKIYFCLPTAASRHINEMRLVQAMSSLTGDWSRYLE